jgi:hypothetical protein
MIAVTPASVVLEYLVGEAKALALPFVTSFCLILHLTSYCKVFLTRLGLHIGRVDQVNTSTTLMIGNLYIIPKCMQYRLLMILLGPLSMLLGALRTRDLGPGRVEPPEDVGKGGDLWHGRAGADDGLQ